jgi:hypothetical protein
MMTKLRNIVLSTVCLELSACTQYTNRYVERIDTVNFSSGDSLATNAALMVPTPWPRYAYDTNIETDGERIRDAVDRYRAGEKQPIETLPQRKVTFGSKFSDANAGPGQSAAPSPAAGFFVPLGGNSGGGLAPPAPTPAREPASEAPPPGYRE